MNRQRGVTLVELVIAIVIVGIAAAALYSAMASITSRSADPMLRQQSLMLAEACMEELLARNFDGLDSGTCTLTRASAGDAGLADYVVAVSVEATPFADSIPASEAWHVEVTVVDPAGQPLTLSGWRTCYGESVCEP